MFVKKIPYIILISLLIFGMFAVSISALTSYSVVIYDLSLDTFTGIRFKSDTDSGWSSYYTSGQTRVASYDYSLQAQITLAAGDTYTGSFLIITENSDSVNIASRLTGIEPDLWGNVYIPDNTIFNLFLTTDVQSTFYLSAYAVNYSNYISQVSGYDAGYDDGYSTGYGRAYNDLYLPTLTELNALKDSITDATGGIDINSYSDSIKNEAYAAGVRDSAIVPNTLKSVFNAVGRFFGQFLTLEILGIKLYQIVLVFAFVPVGIWIAHKFIAHGG